MPKYSSFKKQQILTENFRRFLSEGHDEDRDDRKRRGPDIYKIDPLTGDQKAIGVSMSIKNPQGHNLISDWSDETVTKRGREDALAGLEMDSRYSVDADYSKDTKGDRVFKQRAAKTYRAAYAKAKRARSAPMSRKSLEEG